jgi:hypothetical protein
MPDPASVRDFQEFHRHLRIIDHHGQNLVPLVPHDVQWRVRAPIVEAEKQGTPARIIVLKARREGVSTIVQATFFHRAATRKHVHTLTVAHQADSSSYLHEMTERMYGNLPQRLRPTLARKHSGLRLDFAHGSSMRVKTAGGDAAGIGRGFGGGLLHASEVAFWGDAKKSLLSLRQIVPPSPGTIIVLESTANGVGDPFHDEWQRAVRGESGYTPLFFSWFDYPKYVAPVPKHMTLETLDEDEQILAGKGVTLEQLAWRRQTIANECAGDVDFFNQEYPDSPEVAFLTSGRRYFGDAINQFLIVPPVRRGELEGEMRKGNQIKFHDHPKGPLWIYQMPIRDGRRYAMFCDIAGTLSPREFEDFKDRGRARDAADYSVCWVVDCSNGETVAVWHDRLDTDLFAAEAAKLGMLYSKAIICPEMNAGFGATMVQVLRNVGYPHIETRYALDTYTQKRSVAYGWNTSAVTRPLMLDALRAILRESPHLLKHEALKTEMSTFVMRRNGTPGADAGCHDDLVMAAAGAYQMYQKYAKRVSVAKPKSRVQRSIAQRAQAA